MHQGRGAGEESAVRAGQYLLLKALQPIAFAYGGVRMAGGPYVSGAEGVHVETKGPDGDVLGEQPFDKSVVTWWDPLPSEVHREGSQITMRTNFGLPSYVTVSCASSRRTVAVWGILCSIRACCARGVPGTAGSASPAGCVAGMRAKSGGKLAPGT